MARVQYNYLQRKDAYSTAATGTVTYDLPEAGFVPEVVLRVFSTPSAATNPALPINDAITKIEVIDGGTVIKSYTGNQCHGLEMIHRRHERASTEKNDNGVEGYDEFLIVLGGLINGVEYAPDMSRFANPQIKITWDYSTTTNEFGVPYDADTAPVMKFTLLAKIVREGGKYTSGYIKSNEIYTWTSATSSTTQTELPLGEKLLGLMIEAGYTTKDWTEDIEQIKLDFDNGDWIPLDIYEEEIAKIQEEWFGNPFELSFTSDMISGKVMDTHMGYVQAISLTPMFYETTDSAIGLAYPSGTQGIGTVRIISGTVAMDTYKQYKFNVTGFMPYQCWYCPMSKILDGESDVIDTSTYSRIILETVSGSSAHTSSTPAVIAEWLVT